ncbi:MAG: hypothetical protein B7Y56_13845 [Gallionellales bacterium 35-53-114]|jgi:hypothetical protein|nr:MAG: hypothetical protein B7Y56_13845 [Gallionellales bacterium 35-53-114]OYZ62991.1 MAG: hypothetical protein B7Y04_10970 [Gallionellales bacterium 24-53-125]OZB09028.1 MAG: hypothetical protein B7X61_08630 [Gallionellales bacterium 39-52-133]HQS59289.1 hypothetical protein [Gallionellaceae bacterium]HQS76202.1 hypothetical protein [Gallionellaceae bacterium]
MRNDHALPEQQPTGDNQDISDDIHLIENLFEMLSAIQHKGRQLENDAHNETYDLANEFNQHLHQAHLQLRKLRSSILPKESDMDERSGQTENLKDNPALPH